jgi:hypothetical protein
MNPTVDVSTNVFYLKGAERKLEFLKRELKNTKPDSIERKLMEQEIYKINQMLGVDRYIGILAEIVKLLNAESVGLDYKSKCASANFTLECIRRYFRGIEVVNHLNLGIQQLESKANWARIMLNAFGSGL